MDQDFYIGLIHQGLQGTLSEEGQRQLADWRSADPEHQELEQQIRKSWELSQQYEPALELDATAAFNVLRTRVRAHEKENTATVRPINSNRRVWIGIAAAVLFLLTAGWFILPSLEGDGPMATLETGPGEPPREVALSDGSKIWLRENSQLEYPEKFARKSREVTLVGEAYFDVAKDANAPFQIALPGNAAVEVLGTSFLVSARKDSTIAVTVNSGKVALNGGNKVLLLRGGKAGTWNPVTEEIAELNYQPNAAAWRNNTLIFDDQPMTAVVRDLEGYFNVTIVSTTGQLKNCRFGGRFPEANLIEVLDAMKQTFDLKWQQDGDTYLLSDGSCQ